MVLQEAGREIIVDDITYISESFFKYSVVAQAVEAVSATGAAYFSAAGNFGTKSWEGDFSPTAAPGDLEEEAHNFDADEEGNDIYQNITVDSGDYTLVLQWDDGTPEFDNTASDFDIYLVNNEGEILFGFNRVNMGGFPCIKLVISPVDFRENAKFPEIPEVIWDQELYSNIKEELERDF